MSNNKKIRALPEGFVDAFSSAINNQFAVEQSIKRPEKLTDLEEEVQGLRRKISIAQQGGVGDVSKLTRQLSESKNRLINETRLAEAKMKDSEVLSAAKALAANGKDEKAKSFGKGLVDFYAKNNSFTPDQVSGLQNIMKNASFQLAKEETDVEKKFAKDTKKTDDGEGMDPVGKGDADIDNDGDSDNSDEYLHKRRKAIAKSMKRESVELDESKNPEEMALVSALGFGGAAEPSQKSIIDKLEKDGLVTGIQKTKDVNGDVYYYKLTPEGRKKAVSLKNKK